jgi:hypothetical protein
MRAVARVAMFQHFIKLHYHSPDFQFSVGPAAMPALAVKGPFAFNAVLEATYLVDFIFNL